VSKTFGGAVRALDGVNLSLPAGELVALIGGNGAGKSTLLKILFGSTGHDAGSVRVLGLDPRRDRSSLRARIGYAGQDVALDPEISGWETLALFYALRALPHQDRRERLQWLAEEYDLLEFCDRPVGGYSGGQRQRLHLAIETMHEPSLLLLDEPTASLDPGGRRALWERLAAWRDRGHTVLVTTHDLEDIAAHCDRVLLLERGRLIAEGHPAALIAEHGRARTVITLERPPGPDAGGLREALGALEGAPEVAIEGRTVTLWRDRHPGHGEPALDLLTARGIPYYRYERWEPDLANAYFRLTGSPWGSGPDRGGAGRGRGRGRNNR